MAAAKPVRPAKFAGACETCGKTFVIGSDLIAPEGTRRSRARRNRGALVPAWHHIECLGLGADGLPLPLPPIKYGPPEPEKVLAPEPAPEPVSGHDAAQPEGFEAMSVVDLRTAARAASTLAGDSRTTWIASARKSTLVEYLRTGAHPDGPELPSSSVGATSSADAEAVAQIAAEAARKAAAEAALDAEGLREDITKIVEEVLKGIDPVKVERLDGEVENVAGEHPLFADLLFYAQTGIRTWIAGPAGSGKTSAVVKVAQAVYGNVFLATPESTKYDVLGYRDAHGRVVETQISRWARFEGDAALIVDEIDGWLETAQLSANAVIANGTCILPDGEVDITHGGKFRKWVVSTANTWGLGATAEYVGRRKMDGAFRNRFDAKLFWGYDEDFEIRLAEAHAPSEKKAEARRVAVAVQLIRRAVDDRGIKIIISPRQTIAATKAHVHGREWSKIIDEILLAEVDEGTRDGILRDAGVGRDLL